MDYNYSDLIPRLIDVLTELLKDTNYLIKGGQAISIHMKRMSHESDSRFSRDLDVSFSKESFPIKKDVFKERFSNLFNSIEKNMAILAEDIIINKLPKDEQMYFGIKMIFNVHKINAYGQIGKKIFFKDIDGLAILIDFSCSEVVESNYIEFIKPGIKIATLPLIIAEKYRSLCSQIKNAIDEKYKPTPRPKDFFDLFLIFNISYHRKLKDQELDKIKDALIKCFQIKNINLELLKNLYSENVKNFHATAFDDQVKATLSRDSIYFGVTYDQVYSESLELLDAILSRYLND